MKNPKTFQSLSGEFFLSWKTIALATAFSFAILRLTGNLFYPIQTTWTLAEDFQNFQKPSHVNLSAGSAGLSAGGLVIGVNPVRNPPCPKGTAAAASGRLISNGVNEQGWVQWNFAAPGALPSTIQLFFLPDMQFPSGVYLVTDKGNRIPLCKNLPVRNRSFNIQNKITGLSSFAIRLEGQNAVLKEIKFRQSGNPAMPLKCFFPLMLCLTLFFLRGVILRKPFVAILSVITAAGLILRCMMFYNYWNMPLEGDAVGYWNYARFLKISTPFNTGPREPLFIWLLWLAKTLFGDSERTSRFLTLFFSCSIIPMTWMLARRLGMKISAHIAAIFAAINPFSVFMSVQGLQLEFFTFLILVFSSLWLEKRTSSSGAAGAALILTRIQSAAAVFPLALITALKSRQKPGQVFVLFLLPALTLALVLVAAKANTGRFTGNLDHAARYYAAAETKGDPGMAQSMGDMNLEKYLFSGNAVFRLALKTAEGYFQIIFNPFNSFNRIFLNSHYSRPWNILLLPFLWSGLWFFLSGRGNRSFLWLPLFFLSALPALHDQFREPRLLFHAAPFFFITCASGLEWALSTATNILRSCSTR
ncbi:MAG: glycosyltransferase family 39 protein [Elusimicrobia bacterium]|nr:glycosyltransferase family 39 protein [Elusimicrobiota bacterium]